MIDPVTIAAVGQGMQGAGSLISAVKGLFGGKKKPLNAFDQVSDQMMAQRRLFAQHVKSYKDAGFHPLLAAGVQPSGGMQFQIGGGGDRDLGASVAQMGQGISRASEAMMAREERDFNRTLTALQVENGELQNERLRAEIRLMTQPGTPPGMIADSGQVIPETQRVMTHHGVRTIPSTEYGQVMENYWPESWRYMFLEMLRDAKELRSRIGGSAYDTLEWLSNAARR